MMTASSESDFKKDNERHLKRLKRKKPLAQSNNFYLLITVHLFYILFVVF